jgi:hypothetical protein
VGAGVPRLVGAAVPHHSAHPSVARRRGEISGYLRETGAASRGDDEESPERRRANGETATRRFGPQSTVRAE